MAMPDGREVKVWPAAVKVTSSSEVDPERRVVGMDTVVLSPMTRPEDPRYTSMLSIVACAPFCEMVVLA